LSHRSFSTSNNTDHPTTTNPEICTDRQSPRSSASSHLLNDSDSGYGSPPAKPTDLADPPSLEQTTLPPFSPGHSMRSARSSWPRVSTHLSVEEEQIEIVGVPADSLMDCICQTCSAPQERIPAPSGWREKDETVISSDQQYGTPSAFSQDTSQFRRASGWNLKGLRIWTPSRSKARQQR
jgi:hypothetical protein